LPDFLRQFSGDLLAAFTSLGYPGVFLLMAVEASGIPLPFPGPILLIVAGSDAAQGELNLVVTGLVAATGSTLGALALYTFSARGGLQFIQRYGRYLALSETRLAAFQKWFHEHGGMATLLGRLVPGTRIYVSIPAGLSHLTWLRFIVSTFLGCFAWCFAFVLVGRVLGASWRLAAQVFDTAEPLVLWGAILGVIGLLLWHSRNHRKR
jgi:membrane protein DedA with SNARE-associated domain